jgi:hypothetical protein
MRPLLTCLLAVVLFLPLALRAADPPADPDAEEWEGWQQELRAAQQTLAEARERHEAAELAYKRMRHRNRERGAAKAAILVEREEAALALVVAEQDLETLREEARRAGVPPGWLELDEAEEPAAPER